VSELPAVAPEEIAHRAAYERAWRDRRSRMRWFFIAWLGGFLAVGTIGVALRLNDKGAFALFVPWAGLFLFTAIRWGMFRCPRCGERFASKSWAGGLIGYHNTFTSRCLHCRLRVGEVPPLGEPFPTKSSVWLGWWPPKVAAGKVPMIVSVSGRLLCLMSVGMPAMALLQRLMIPTLKMPVGDHASRFSAGLLAMHSLSFGLAPGGLLIGLLWWRAGNQMPKDDDGGRRLGRIASRLAIVGGIAYVYALSRVLPTVVRALPIPDVASGVMTAVLTLASAVLVIGYPVLVLSLLGTEK
jgi:hypothetical protein